MKKIIFLLAFFLNLSISSDAQCNVYFNQLDISINTESSEVLVSGLDCDICEYGIGGSSICGCRNRCFEQEEFLDCQQNCYSLINEQEEELCQDNCWKKYMEGCLEDCGDLPPKKRVAESYQAYADIWYNTSFTETFDGDPLVLSPIYSQSKPPPNTVNIPLFHKFPEKAISYCYVVYTIVRYNDGSCCVFVDFGCYNLG